MVYHGSSRQHFVSEFQSKDIIITTYETLRAEWLKKGPLYSKPWYRLVLDEGQSSAKQCFLELLSKLVIAHHIRNRSSQIFKATCAITAQNRWCLTGTPIHNSLDDYGALLSFLGVPPFETKSMFDFWIATPFKEQRSWSLDRLQSLIRATCLRRTKKLVNDSLKLPPYSERVETIELPYQDRELYNFFKQRTSMIAAGLHKTGTNKVDGLKDTNIISLINFLRLICNHGKELLPRSALDAWESRDSSSIEWEVMQSGRETCETCNAELEQPDFTASYNSNLDCEHICSSCASPGVCVEMGEEDIIPTHTPTISPSSNLGPPKYNINCHSAFCQN
jgi:SNF2 family DNA or RNA helicase